MNSPIVPARVELAPDPSSASAHEAGTHDPSGTFSVHVHHEGSSRHSIGKTQLRLAAAGYLALGLGIGLGILLLLSLLSKRDAQVPARDGQTHKILHLHHAQIDSTCWHGIKATDRTARLTVVMLVGVDGRVHNASSAGATPTMRGCVETYARGLEFMPLASAQTVVMPIEVDSN